MKYIALTVVMLLAGCEALTPIAKTALHALLPKASEMLTQAVLDRFDDEADQEDVHCLPLGIDNDDLTYVTCRGKGEDLLPRAADALTQAVDDRFDADIDQDSAICFSLGRADPQGYTYIVCEARAVE